MAVENEPWEHLALKLGAYLSCWDAELILAASAKHPALGGFEYRPDLLGIDATGAVSSWIECGNTSLNKVAKALRRFPSARVAVFREDPPKARRQRQELEAEGIEAGRVEVLGWPTGSFARWCGLLGEKTEAFGEAGGTSMNLVVNEAVFAEDLVRF